MHVLEHPLVVSADAFATQAHAAVGQLQPYTGLPYCEHTRAVAALAAHCFDDPVVVAAAHLHDTMEDAGVTKLDLAARFGVPVAELVDEVSSKATKDMGNRAARVAFVVRRLADISAWGQGIKCCDVAVNMRDIVELAPDCARTYVPEQRLLLPSLVNAHAGLYELARRAIEGAEAKLLALPSASHRSRRRP